MFRKIFYIFLSFVFLGLLFNAPSYAHGDDDGKCSPKLKDYTKLKLDKKYFKSLKDLKKDNSYLYFRTKYKYCLPFSIPYNLPDGWILTHINLDLDREYTRIFNFQDITNECRYAVKNDRDYKGWCIDQNLMGTPDYDYIVRLFNITGEFPDYGTFDTPKGEVDLRDFLFTDYEGDDIPYDKILYIINNRDGYSKAAVQEAIWYYTMGDGYFDPETTEYIELVNAAEEYGDGYIPPCDGKLFVFAITKAAEATPDLEPCKLGQPFIIEMPIPSWMCRFGFLERYLKRFYDRD